MTPFHHHDHLYFHPVADNLHIKILVARQLQKHAHMVNSSCVWSDQYCQLVLVDNEQVYLQTRTRNYAGCAYTRQLDLDPLS